MGRNKKVKQQLMRFCQQLCKIDHIGSDFDGKNGKTVERGSEVVDDKLKIYEHLKIEAFNNFFVSLHSHMNEQFCDNCHATLSRACRKVTKWT